jgi:hypothetical protein
MVLTRDERLTWAEQTCLNFEPVMRGLHIGLWPNGACFLTSLLLVPILRTSLEWSLGVVVGKVKLPEGEPAHAWIESPEGDIIDPTYGMFDFGKPLRILRTEQRESLGHVSQVRLSENDENYFRESIQPWTGDNGWRPNCGVKELFGTE